MAVVLAELNLTLCIPAGSFVAPIFCFFFVFSENDVKRNSGILVARIAAVLPFIERRQMTLRVLLEWMHSSGITIFPFSLRKRRA